MDTQKKKSFIISVTYTVLVVALIYVIYRFLIIYLLPFAIGLILAYLLQKPSDYISGKLRIKKGTVSAVLVVISFVSLVAVLFSGGVLIYYNAEGIVNYLKDMVESISAFLSNLSGKYASLGEKLPKEFLSAFQSFSGGLSEKFSNFLTDAVSNLAASLIKKLPGVAFSIVVTVIASCYIAKDYEIVKDYILSLIPERKKRIVFAVKRILTVNIFKIVKGYLILMLITFFELYIAFWITGQQNPLRTAILIAIIDLLPVLGTGAVLVPWGAVLILNSNYTGGLIIIGIYVIVMLVRNFLEPRIVGKQIGIPPIVSLILLFCGLKLFGFLGTIFSILSLVVIINLYKEKIIEL